jgi:WD40 repeat protein
MDIFLSYSRRNVNFTRLVAEHLKSSGHEVWVDWEDIPFSSDWWKEIMRGMDGCQAVVLIVTPEFLRSDVCNREMTYARNSNKRMIPILHQEIDEEAMTAYWAEQKWGENAASNWDAVRAHNWLFCRTEDEHPKAFTALLETINRDPENAHYHTRLLVRAREWQNSDKPGGGRDESLLLRGDELRRAESWLQFNRNQEPRPTSLHSIYIGASVALRQEEEERSERQRLRLRQMVGLLSVLLVFALVSIGIAVAQSLVAQQNSELALTAVAQAESSAGTAQANLRESWEAQALYRGERAQAELQAGRPQTGLLLALEALENVDAGIYNTNSQLALTTAITSDVQELAYFSHDSTVNLAVWSADRRRVATISAFTITVWSVDERRQLARLNHASTAFVRGALFTVDGQRLLAWDSEGVARLWHIDTGTSLLMRHPRPLLINSASFSPDERRVLTASEDGLAMVWDASNGAQLAALPHDSSVSGAVFSGNGALTLTWARDRTARVWDMQQQPPALIATFEHDANVRGAVFNRSYTQVLSWTRGSSAYLWDIRAPEQPLHTFSHEDQVNTAVFSADERQVLTASADGRARVWSAIDGGRIESFSHTSAVESAIFSPDARRIIVVTGTGDIVIWETDYPEEPLNVLQGAAVQRAILSADGRQLLAWSRGAARVWDLRQDPPTASVMTQNGEVYGALWDEANRRVLTWGDDGTARVWRVSASSEPRVFPEGQGIGVLLDPLRTRLTTWESNTVAVRPITNSFEQPANFRADSVVEGVSWSPTGQRIATLSDGGLRVQIWSLSSPNSPVADLIHLRRIAGMAWGRNGRVLVTWDIGGVGVSSGSTVTVWTIDSGDQTRDLGAQRLVLPHNAPVSGVTVNPAGTRVATWSGSTVIIWPLADGLRQTVNHTDVVGGAVFNTSGTRLLTWSFDGTARLWDTETGRQVAIYRHDGSVNGARFNRDATQVLTWSSDSRVRVWQTETGLMLHSMEHQVALQGQIFPLVVVDARWNLDDRYLLARTDDGQVRVWDMTTSPPTSVTLRHEGAPIRDALWSDDGLRLLTWDDVRTVRVWDVSSGYRTVVLPHPNGLRGAAWTADPSRVLTWSADGARVWLVDVRSLIALGETQRVRDLSNQERADILLPTYTPSPTVVLPTQTPLPSLTPTAAPST